MKQQFLISLDEEEVKLLDLYRYDIVGDYKISREEACRQVTLNQLDEMEGLDPVPSEGDDD